jgi:hypothetical protein
VHQKRRRCRVADAHFADRHHVSAGIDRCRDDRRPSRQAIARLLGGKCGFARGVAAAAPDLGVDQSGTRRDVRIDAGIDDLHIDARRLRQRADAGSSGKIGRDHRAGDARRIERNALGDETMVGGEDEHGRAFGARRQRIPDQAELNREILQPAKRAERLRLAVNAGAKLRLERSIDRFDLQIIQCGGRRFGLHLALLNKVRDESSSAPGGAAPPIKPKPCRREVLSTGSLVDGKPCRPKTLPNKRLWCALPLSSTHRRTS